MNECFLFKMIFLLFSFHFFILDEAICIAKDFIWTNLKVIFSKCNFLLPQIIDFKIVVSRPNIVLS